MSVFSSKYFAIDIEEVGVEGIYCSYCGEKLTPHKDDDTGGYEFQCTCSLAQKEIALQEELQKISEDLVDFEEATEDQVVITESTVKSKVYQEYIKYLQQKIAVATKTAEDKQKSLYAKSLNILNRTTN